MITFILILRVSRNKSMRYNITNTKGGYKPKKVRSGIPATNYEEGPAFIPDNHTKLYLMSATQMVKTEKFYGDSSTQYQEWVSLVREVAAVDPVFVLRLAAYIRNEMKLRTAPIVLMMEVLLADFGTYNAEKSAAIKKYAPYIIKRADEMAECIAYFKSIKGDVGNGQAKGSLPNVLKRVINSKLEEFTPYQLIKNDKNSSSVKLRDVLRICHPKPKDKERSELYRRIVKGESFPDVSDNTWEGYISKHGSSKETWSAIIETMPIMALLRNIRNFLDNDIDPALLKKFLIDRLNNVDQIRNSRLLPFRFYQAYKEIEERNFNVNLALEAALTHATDENIPQLNGKNAIFVDTSGSMDATLNDKTSIRYNEIACLFGALLYRKNPQNTRLFGYDSNVRELTQKIRPRDSIFHNLKQIQNTDGGATYANKCIALMLSQNIFADRIIFLSDMQSYSAYEWSSQLENQSVQALVKRYRLTVNESVRVYDIDLSGYGTVQFDPNNMLNVQIGGWSERIFEFMEVLEQQSNINISALLAEKYP